MEGLGKISPGADGRLMLWICSETSTQASERPFVRWKSIAQTMYIVCH